MSWVWLSLLLIVGVLLPAHAELPSSVLHNSRGKAGLRQLRIVGVAAAPHLTVLGLPSKLNSTGTVAGALDNQHATLPICQPVVLALQSEATGLRDALQLQQYRGRADVNAPPRGAAAELMKSSAASAALAAANNVTSTVSACAMGGLNRNLNPGTLQVSYLLQYFKRAHVIQRHAEVLMACRQAASSELLVNVDSRSEVGEWAALVASTNGFVVPVFSANIHESRAYNRLARVARGELLMLLQDDEYGPSSCAHIKNVVNVFHKYPLIGAMGHRGFRHCKANPDQYNHAAFVDAALKVSFTYAQVVDMAPLVLRRTTWLSIGGMDEDMSDPGICGIWGDWEIAMRVWMDGWQVVHMGVEGGLTHDTTTTGATHTPENGVRCWGRQQNVAGGHFQRRFSNALQTLVCQQQFC